MAPCLHVRTEPNSTVAYGKTTADGTVRPIVHMSWQCAADEEAIKKREADKTAYTKLWNEFGKALKMGVVEDTANRNRLAKLLRVCFPAYWLLCGVLADRRTGCFPAYWLLALRTTAFVMHHHSCLPLTQ